MLQVFSAQENVSRPSTHDILNNYGQKVAESVVSTEGTWNLTVLGSTYTQVVNCNPAIKTLEGVVGELDKYYQQLLQGQLEAYTRYLELSEYLLTLPRHEGSSRRAVSDKIVESYEEVQTLGNEIRALDYGNLNQMVLVCTDEKGEYQLRTGHSATGSHYHTKGFTKAVRVPELSIISELGEDFLYVKPFDYACYNEFND